MSGANRVLPDITLDELSRLIRILGLMGSAHDGEALAAARFAVRWVAEHQTSWEALLVPEPEQGVVSVVAVADPNETSRLEEAAYEAGYREGLKVMAAQVKAQAGLGAAQVPPQSRWTQTFTTMAGNAPGAGLGGSGAQVPPWARAKAQGPVRGSGTSPGTSPGAAGGGAGKVWPAGSWQAVAQALLDRDASGVPAVFRGSREQQFVADVLARGFASLTPAQDTWLRDIAGRNGMNW